jgi:hypothetical protein
MTMIMCLRSFDTFPSALLLSCFCHFFTHFFRFFTSSSAPSFDPFSSFPFGLLMLNPEIVCIVNTDKEWMYDGWMEYLCSAFWVRDDCTVLVLLLLPLVWNH